MIDERDDFLTPHEAAAWLRVSEGTLRSWAWRRRVPSQKVNGRLVFSAAALRAWLRSQERSAGELG